MKLCLCFNFPALYRESIYKQIDKEYDCDWFFEDQESIVKTFDPKILNSSTFLPIKKIGPFYWVKSMMKLLKGNYDVYLMMGATRNLTLFPFMIFKNLFFRKKKIFLWTHGFYGKENIIELALWKRPLFKLPDALFTYGDYAKKIMVEDGFNPDTIFPIHNSLNYAKQLELRNKIQPSDIYKDHFGNTYPVIVFIGRLTEVKKLDMILYAVSLLKEKGENYNVAFVGDGVKRQQLKDLTKKLELTDKVWFYGACFDEKANAELLYNADLCVAPGNIGLTSIHALMFGCPCISHNDFKWQMPEFETIQPGVTGDFFERDNVVSFAEKISGWFMVNANKRDIVRNACYRVIDLEWNPDYQMDVIKKNLKI